MRSRKKRADAMLGTDRPYGLTEVASGCAGCEYRKVVKMGFVMVRQ